MTHRVISAFVIVSLCLPLTVARAAPRGEKNENTRGGSNENNRGGTNENNERNESEKSKNQNPNASSAPGGDWSERSHSGKQSSSGATTGANAKNNTSMSGKDGKETTPTTSSPTSSTPTSTASSTQSQNPAAQSANPNNNKTQYSAAQGMAAGAAVSNRNQPQYSGAEGAAAGAAAANNRNPQSYGVPSISSGVPTSSMPQYSVPPTGMPSTTGQQSAQGNPATGAPGNNPQSSQAQGNPASQSVVANYNPNANAPNSYATVRSSFDGAHIYTQQWTLNHPGAWVAPGWPANAAWQLTPWTGVAGFCGYGAVTPISYDYGVNVVAQNGNVLVNGTSVGTTAEYSQQALDLALTGADANVANQEWIPLGVYAMVRNENQTPHFIVQLAINKQGILRGNYTDDVSDNTLPIRGAADKKSMRAAWIVGDNKDTAMEAGLADLTENEAPALIHKRGKTDHWLLVRLTTPTEIWQTPN